MKMVSEIVRWIGDVLISWIVSLAITCVCLVIVHPSGLAGLDLWSAVFGGFFMVTLFILPFLLPVPIAIELIIRYSTHKKAYFFSIVALQILALFVGVYCQFYLPDSDLNQLWMLTLFTSGFTIRKYRQVLDFSSESE